MPDSVTTPITSATVSSWADDAEGRGQASIAARFQQAADALASAEATILAQGSVLAEQRRQIQSDACEAAGDTVPSALATKLERAIDAESEDIAGKPYRSIFVDTGLLRRVVAALRHPRWGLPEEPKKAWLVEMRRGYVRALGGDWRAVEGLSDDGLRCYRAEYDALRAAVGTAPPQEAPATQFPDAETLAEAMRSFYADFPWEEAAHSIRDMYRERATDALRALATITPTVAQPGSADALGAAPPTGKPPVPPMREEIKGGWTYRDVTQVPASSDAGSSPAGYVDAVGSPAWGGAKAEDELPPGWLAVELADAAATIAAQSAAKRLKRLRDAGWMVAVHNDYRQAGKRATSWLFTRGNVALKGEGATDDAALAQVENKARALTGGGEVG